MPAPNKKKFGGGKLAVPAGAPEALESRSSPRLPKEKTGKPASG